MKVQMMIMYTGAESGDHDGGGQEYDGWMLCGPTKMPDNAQTNQLDEPPTPTLCPRLSPAHGAWGCVLERHGVSEHVLPVAVDDRAQVVDAAVKLPVQVDGAQEALHLHSQHSRPACMSQSHGQLDIFNGGRNALVHRVPDLFPFTYIPWILRQTSRPHTRVLKDILCTGRT